MKNITSIVVAVLSFASSVIAGSAFAGQMYVNNLATPDATIPTGEYGSITVPEGGYKATAFSTQTSVSDGIGSYAGIMKVGGSYYVDTHTVSGWFSVTLPTDSSLKTIYFAQGDVGTNHGKGHTGYRLAVDSSGVLYVGKTGDDEGTTWQDNEYKKTTMGVISNETWCYVTVALEVNVSSEAATPHIFINGESAGMEEGTFRINVWGTSCANFFIGADVSAAGLYIDTEAVTDTSKIIGWATEPYYVESASSTSRPEVETAATKWSEIENWDPPFKSGKDVMAKLTLLGPEFDFDEGVTASVVVVDSASDVVLTASKIPSIARYDLSGCTAKSTLAFDPGDAIVVAGSETKVTVSSTNTEYLIDSGKRLYVEDPTVAAGKITQNGLLGYWGMFDIDTPTSTEGEGIEFAGTNTLKTTIGNCSKPTYFSGTITVSDGLFFVNGRETDLRIIGGETRLAGTALLSHSNNSGAKITVSGGVLKGESDKAYIYYGGYANGVIYLTVNGTGRWEASIKPHADSRYFSKDTVTINVSEQGVFAPVELEFSNDATAVLDSKTKIQVYDGGTFEMPANVPYWIPEEVTSGTATNVISGNTEMAAPLTVAEGATLVIRGPKDATLSLSKISGTGTVIVEGATLDLSNADHLAFTGSISTTGDGKLLPEGLGENDAYVSVTTDEPISVSGWADLPWKGFFGADVNPSVWATGEENASFTGSGRVEIGAIADGVLPNKVFIADGVTLAVGGENVLPGTIANAGTVEYTGTQSFGDAREGIDGKVILTGEHAFTLTESSTGTGFNSLLSGLTFDGTNVFSNTSTYADTGFAKSFTSASAPLNVTGGLLDLGNLYLYAAHEDNAHTWNASLSNDAIVRGGFICWGYSWYAKCDIVLNKGTRLETPMGPMNNGNEARADAYMRVTVNGSATFAPAYLRTTDVEPILKDYEPDGKYANNLQVQLRPADEGNNATPTFELPEVVPSWVEVDVYAPGAKLLIPEGRSVAWNAYTWSENSNRHLWLTGAGTFSLQEKGTFAGTSLRLDGPTVVIGDRPIECRDFTYISGSFRLDGRKSGPRLLVKTEVAMSDEIVMQLPLIEDRNYVLSDDKLELRSVPKPGFLILLK